MTPNWVDITAAPFSAVGDGVTDNTTAIQSAFNYAMTAATSTLPVYIPAGKFMYTASVTVSTTNPVTVIGDGMGAYGTGKGQSALCPNPSSAPTTPFTALSVSNTCNFTMRDVDILAYGTVASFSDTFIGVQLTSCNDSRFERIHIDQGVSGLNRINQGIVIDNSLNTDIDASMLFCQVNAVYATGTSGAGSPVISLRGTTVSSVKNSFANYGITSADILLNANCGTLHLTNVLSDTGDWALVSQNGLEDDEPGFYFIYDFEVNNPTLGGILLNSGASFWADQLWLSDSSQSSTVARPGLEVGSGFTGMVYLANSNVGDFPGHGVLLNGGSGYTITGCTFGGNGKNASDTYDDIHIGPSVSNVTITDNHFNVDPFNGFGSPAVRSSVYTQEGATVVTLSGNQFGAAASYGTAPVIDMANAITGPVANAGWKPAMQSDPGVQTVSGTAYQNLSGQFDINIYEATVGDVYRLVAWGHGTQGTTAQNLDLQGMVGTNNFCFTIMSGATIGASNGFHWKCVLEFQIITAAVSGSISPSLQFTWSEAVTTTSSNAATASGDNTSGSVTMDTQASNTVTLQAKWASTTGSPTISCEGSYLEAKPL